MITASTHEGTNTEMPRIIHACSSILVRPNGIVRYINTVIDFQKNLGHDVAFVSDAAPAQIITSNTISYSMESSGYVPNMRNGHVWLQIDDAVINHVRLAYEKIRKDDDVIFVHDLHSYLALHDLSGVFIQHESDVLNQGSRYSFLSDEYLEKQIQCIKTTHWRVGLTARRDELVANNKIFAPIPFFPMEEPSIDRTRRLLYIGDGTERKGAAEFMDTARRLNEVPTVITHEPDSDVFAGAEIFSFALDQKTQMTDVMKTCKAAYLPSRNETLCLAAIECLQFMPVVVNHESSWTSSIEEIGALRIAESKRDSVIKGLLESTGANYRRPMLIRWSDESRRIWEELSAGNCH